MEEDVKVNGLKIKKMIQEEFDQEMVEMREELNKIMMLLHEGLRCSWKMKKHVKWPVKKFFVRKFRKKMRCLIRT
jgi:hypothetical protein